MKKVLNLIGILFKSQVLGKSKQGVQCIFTKSWLKSSQSSVCGKRRSFTHGHKWENFVPGKSLAIASIGNFNLEHVIIIWNGIQLQSNSKSFIDEKMWHSTFLMCIVYHQIIITLTHVIITATKMTNIMSTVDSLQWLGLKRLQLVCQTTYALLKMMMIHWYEHRYPSLKFTLYQIPPNYIINFQWFNYNQVYIWKT